jgi:Fe-S-cluster containining protein
VATAAPVLLLSWGMAEAPNPCREHGCYACCLDTRMTLTLADVARLEATGHTGFCGELDDGSWVLRNVDGHCVFLVVGRCSVYARRPEGCRLYPLVLDLDKDRVVRDDFCPFRREFRLTRRDKIMLRASVTREENEAEARRSSHG